MLTYRYCKKSIVSLLFLGIAAAQAQQTEWKVPLGGNSWSNGKAAEKLTVNGWTNWQSFATTWSTYVKVSKPGSFRLAAVLAVPQGMSRISFSINGVTKSVEATGASPKQYEAGEWTITDPGYIKIETRGLAKTGAVFANASAFIVSGTAVDSSVVYVKNNEGNDFYWGRRGPSVHISYTTPVKDSVEWFYNEITVPEGNDVIGSYFMANGFAEGYFGIQVNSERERRVIFSVWSPFQTDNPAEVPADQKIITAKKGKGVVANEFGNEGSGGHSHLVYNWKAGQTYRFLLHARPREGNKTQYTALFFDPEHDKWLLIASFIRPKTNTWLKRPHSFLENFVPETGNISRMAYYHNQWIKPVGKAWLPLSSMKLTADATARKRNRVDYDGGVLNGKFFLKNGGFFNETATLSQNYSVAIPTRAPDIDVKSLLQFINP